MEVLIMNSNEIVKGLLNQKKYDVITEYAKVQHGNDNADVIVKEYTGANVRLCKNGNGDIEIYYPKNADTVMESTIANAIANGTIFDDADEVDNNATMIEKTVIPCAAMANKGFDEPNTVKKVIAIVIGKMDDDGRFNVSDTDRENGVNFVKDITYADPDSDKEIRDVINNYTEKENDETYDSVVGKDMGKLKGELEDIDDVTYDDTINDDSDTVEDYGDYDMDSFEKQGEENEKLDDEDDEDSEDTGSDSGPDSDNDSDGDTDELSDYSDDTDSDTDDDKSEDDESDDKDDDDDKDDEDEENDKEDDDDVDEPVEECGDAAIPIDGVKPVTETTDEKSKVDKLIEDKVEENKKYEAYKESFLTKKPKKLKPIGRDTVAYITVMINDIHSANDQAMLAGYTCNKIELVDFYITSLDTQDPKYIVPHTRQYLINLKNDLEILLARILRIRPVNRSEQIWRVNYPEYN
jgi:hypothetical protein